MKSDSSFKPEAVVAEGAKPIALSGGPCVNTDREIWRERQGDYYADSIHVTEGGGIGINCGGLVIVKPVREWHKLGRAMWDAAPSQGVGLARDGWELKEAHRRIEAALPEDEPDCVPDWVCRILVGYGRELGPDPNEIIGPVGQPSEPEGGG